MTYKKTGDGGNGGGSAPTDMDDFINSKWMPFAADAGYVANQAPAVGTPPNREFWTHKGSVGVPAAPYIFMRTTSGQLFVMTGTGINTGLNIYEQPGNPANGPVASGTSPDWTAVDGESVDWESGVSCVVVNRAPGAYSGHHLFTNGNGDYIHSVLQVSARRWRHFWMGTLLKFGNFTGGEYYAGSSLNGLDPDSVYDHNVVGLFNNSAASGDSTHRFGMVRIEGLQAGVSWYGVAQDPANLTHNAAFRFSTNVGGARNVTTGKCCSNSWGNAMGAGLWATGASLIANASPLIPIFIFAARDYNGQDVWCPIGQVRDVFRINMKDYQPGDTLTIGSDDYVVFPLANSNIVDTVAGDDYTGWEGLAYKVIP